VLPTFVIYLREGIEASMIVAILLSYLNKVGQRRHFRDVFWGVGVALVFLVAGGIAAYYLVHHYNGSNIQTYFETATFVVAATALTYMTFWMQRHARGLQGELERRTEAALTGKARAGLALLSFQAVGREGLETMVFTLAIVFASSRQAATPIHGRLLLIGALGGLAVALGIAFAIYRLGARINFKVFFQTLGVVLMVFAAGLLADAIENVQQLGWLPFGRHVMWNSSGLVDENSSAGDVLHSLLGYADHPTVLQVAVWVAYVVIAGGCFLAMGRRPRRRPTAAVPSA
jgi:high-affinity iron transporter